MANTIVHPEGEYTIQQVGPNREVSFQKDGNTVSYQEYQVQFEGIPDWIKVNVGSDKPAPKAGETLKGHIEDTGKYGFKFVKEKSGNWGGGGGGKATPGAQWSSAYDTAAKVVSGYFQASGKKPKSIKDYLDKVKGVAPIIKDMVDRSAEADKLVQKDEKSETTPEKPAEPAKPDNVEIEDIDDEALGDW